MKKTKRYEIYKRGELDGRNPPGMNALGAEGEEETENVLENASRHEPTLPRSSLNSRMFDELYAHGGSAAGKKDAKRKERKTK